MHNHANPHIPADTARLWHFGDQGLGPHSPTELLCHHKETISPLHHAMETVPSLGYPLSTKGALRPAQQGSSLGQDYLILLEYVEVKEKKDPLIQRNGGGGEKEM